MTKNQQGETNLVGIGFFIVVCLLILVALCLTKLEFEPRPQTFTSLAKFVTGRKFLTSEGNQEKLTSSDVTIIETVESAQIKKRALGRVHAFHPDLKDANADISVTQAKGSAVFVISAVGEDPEYTKVFLDALLDEFVIFAQQIYDQKHPENGAIGAAATAIMEHASDAYMDNTGRYRIWKLWTDAPPRGL